MSFNLIYVNFPSAYLYKIIKESVQKICSTIPYKYQACQSQIAEDATILQENIKKEIN